MEKNKEEKEEVEEKEEEDTFSERRGIKDEASTL